MRGREREISTHIPYKMYFTPLPESYTETI